MSLKDNLIKIMKRNSLKIKELSKMTGISEPTLKRLRTEEEANPTLDVLIRLSQALDEPIDALVSNFEVNLPVFSQNEKIKLGPKTNKFVVIITDSSFDIENGTKAVFEVYDGLQKITKFILGRDFRLYLKIDVEKNLYKDERDSMVVIEKEQVFAIIVKELYEVDYAQI